jgi:pimeloyl-ACP methyl ester carboxylesterase
MKKIILSFYFLFATSLALAENEELCGQITAPVSYSYCITKTQGSTNKSILYYMHGGGGDETAWSSASPSIYQRWLSQSVNPPIVINISFGPYWLLVEKNPSPNSGLLDVFQNIVMPQIESIATQEPINERMLIGLSMGGFNTTQLLGKLPANTFSRAALVCPAIVNLSPWASDAEIQNFAQQNNANLGTLYNIVQIAQNFVSDETVWNESVSPFTLIEKISASTPSMLIATNEDDYTFKPGGILFAQQLTTLKTPLVTQTWPGGHCDINGSALADFIAQ